MAVGTECRLVASRWRGELCRWWVPTAAVCSRQPWGAPRPTKIRVPFAAGVLRLGGCTVSPGPPTGGAREPPALWAESRGLVGAAAPCACGRQDLTGGPAPVNCLQPRGDLLPPATPRHPPTPTHTCTHTLGVCRWQGPQVNGDGHTVAFQVTRAAQPAGWHL